MRTGQTSSSLKSVRVRLRKYGTTRMIIMIVVIITVIMIMMIITMVKYLLGGTSCIYQSSARCTEKQKISFRLAQNRLNRQTKKSDNNGKHKLIHGQCTSRYNLHYTHTHTHIHTHTHTHTTASEMTDPSDNPTHEQYDQLSQRGPNMFTT